jgi:structural maintenance of chromosome 4
VATDLQTGSHLAYNLGQRYRVVTLQGDLIEASGTMSGGGKPRSGRMGFTEEGGEINAFYTEEDLNQINSELNKVMTELNQVREQMNQAQDGVNKREKECN